MHGARRRRSASSGPERPSPPDRQGLAGPCCRAGLLRTGVLLDRAMLQSTAVPCSCIQLAQAPAQSFATLGKGLPFHAAGPCSRTLLVHAPASLREFEAESGAIGRVRGSQ